jgi:(2R)-sulfolactate sulfo-lyase subunit beta
MARGNGKSNLSFQGWRRENGRVGVRNHVVILPLDDLSNAACEAVANNIKGTLAIPHAYGRLQFGADLELFFRTIIGTGANPNLPRDRRSNTCSGLPSSSVRSAR